MIKNNPKKEFPKSNTFLWMRISGVIYLLLHFFASLNNTPLLWGVDSWRYLPFSISCILLLVGLVLLIPPIQSKTKLVLEKIREGLEKIHAPVWLLIIMAIFYIFRQETFLLGDGLLRIRNVEHGLLFTAEEPLDTFIHTSLYNILNSFTSVSAQDVYQYISIFCGTVAICGLFLFLKKFYENKSDRWIAGGIIVTVGSIQLFFGYVESYTIVACLIMLFLFSTLLMMKRERFTLLPSLFLSFAAISHPTSSLFIPAALYGYYYVINKQEHSKEYIYRKWTQTILIFISIIILLLVLFAVNGFTPADFIESYSGKSNILPLFSSGDVYGIFSLNHFIDIINEILLTTPSVIALFLLIIYVRDLSKSYYIRFLFIAGTGALLFMFIFNPKLGFSRDWDVFALAAFPLTMMINCSILKINGNRIFSIEFTIIIISLLHTAPWIYVNSNEPASIERFENIVGSNHWSNFARGAAYDELRSYYYKKNNFEKSLEFAKKSYEYTKSYRYLINLAATYDEIGKSEEAIKIYEEILKENPFDATVHFNLGYAYTNIGLIEEAVSEFKKAIAINPDIKEAHHNLGIYYKSKKQWDRAKSHLKKAAELDPKDSEVYFKLGVIYGNIDSLNQAEYFFKKTIELNPKDKVAHLNLGIVYETKNETRKSIEHFEKAIEIDPEFSTAYYHLAKIYCYHKRDRKKALENLMKAKKIGFNNKMVMELLIEINKRCK